MDRIRQEFDRLLAMEPDLYAALNAFRDWTNAHVANYEIFLEDNWFDDGRTTIEYTFRSLESFNIEVFAEDTYGNHRDAKGIWHLGAYVRTDWTVPDPGAVIAQFLADNGSPRFRDAD